MRRMLPCLPLLALACNGPGEATLRPGPADSGTPPTPPAPALFAAEPVATAPSAPVGGARTLHVEATQPAVLELALRGIEGVRRWTWPAATVHDVPIVGLRPDAPYTLEVTLVADIGSAQRTLDLVGDPWPSGTPDLEWLALDPSQVHGDTLFSVTTPDADGAWALLLDRSGVPVWWALLDTRLGDLRPTDAGTLIGLGEFTILEVDWLGNEVRRWASAPGLPGDRLPVDLVHHEAWPLPDGGLLTLDQAVVAADAVPVAYDALDTFSPATVVDNGVVELDADGELVRRVALSDVLPTTHVGWNSLDPTALGGALDWVHANAVGLDDDGGWIVSLRHLDAVIKLDADGELVWILGDPAGWPAPWSERLLQPEGDLRWPYHPHAPEVTRIDGELRVLLFDNGNEGHTPYTPAPRAVPPSRLVEYVVDEAAGTVRQRFAYEHPVDGPLEAFALGDADRLPDGQVLGVWGMLAAEGGVDHEAAGRGGLSARIVQIDPLTGEVPFDLRVGSARAERPGGWSVYRAARLDGTAPQVLP